MGTGVSVAEGRCAARRTLSVVIAIGTAMVAAGCGAGAQQLRKPIHQKCETAGVSQCAELSSGMVLYLEGKKNKGAAKMKRALAASPQPKVDEFASSLAGLAARASAKPYMKEIRALAERMRGSEKKPRRDTRPSRHAHGGDWLGYGRGSGERKSRRRPETKAPLREAAEPIVAVTTPDTDPAQITTGTVAPSNHPQSKPCGSLYPSGGQCVAVVQGPFVVTDLTTSGDCGLFAAIGDSLGDPGAPTWIVQGTVDFHGARLAVAGGKSVFVGIGEPDPFCSVTWSGFRPFGEEATFHAP